MPVTQIGLLGERVPVDNKMLRIHRLGRPLKQPVPQEEKDEQEEMFPKYHRYDDGAPKCRCGCGKGLYWRGELLTGYKLSCRSKMREAQIEELAKGLS